jgi:sulfatase maturation enzyme AslB (radical SAM superfamily)
MSQLFNHESCQGTLPPSCAGLHVTYARSFSRFLVAYKYRASSLPGARYRVGGRSDQRVARSRCDAGKRMKYDCFHLVLMVTHQCNLRCDYCYTGRKSARSMSRRVGRVAIDRANHSLAPGGTLELGFFGGEPLLEARSVRLRPATCDKCRSAAAGGTDDQRHGAHPVGLESDVAGRPGRLH